MGKQNTPNQLSGSGFLFFFNSITLFTALIIIFLITYSSSHYHQKTKTPCYLAGRCGYVLMGVSGKRHLPDNKLLFLLAFLPFLLIKIVCLLIMGESLGYCFLFVN
jgi:uncharacterized membrane protein